MKKIIACTLCISLLSGGLVCSTATLSASKIKLNKKKLTMTKGQSYILIVRNNKKPVKWSSSKKKVASVTKKGKVTAKKQGKTNITAKVAAKKLTCKVKVIKAAPNTAPAINPAVKSTEAPNSHQNKPTVTNIPNAAATPDATKEPGSTDAPVTEPTAAPTQDPVPTADPNSLAAAPTEDPDTKDDGWIKGWY